MWTRSEENVITTASIIEAFNSDFKDVVLKWVKKIETKDLLELDKTRLKMDFMMLRCKLDFMNKLGFLNNFDALMIAIDDLEKDLVFRFDKAILNMFIDKAVDALNKPLFKK